MEQRVTITASRVLSVISGACADNLVDPVDQLLINYLGYATQNWLDFNSKDNVHLYNKGSVEAIPKGIVLYHWFL